MSEYIRRPIQKRTDSYINSLRSGPVRRPRAHHGQTLVAALAVLFILLFIGGIFVVNVARNLTDSARSRDTQDALALAKAGIAYCNTELNGSLDGADWRPIPTTPIGPNNGLSDPDYFWLAKGFTRLSLKGGRALVRVAYDPDPNDPLGQTIKIESIGRTGELDFTDPTVFVQNQNSPRLRRELIAYKRIGITDYLRYITDKDKRNGDNYLGVPAVGHYFPQVYGNPMIAQNPTGAANGEILFGGSVYCNSNLNIIGDTFFYEGLRGSSIQGVQPEGISVAGSLVANQFSAAAVPNGAGTSPTATRFDAQGKPYPQALINFPINTSIDTPSSGSYAIPATNDYNVGTGSFGPNANFNTFGGLVRDGSQNAGVNGYSRNIPRIEPPSIDTYANGTGSLRVRQMTAQSGSWINSTLNTGMIGWGSAIYIDNDADRQIETVTPGITGSYSLPADWTNPNAGFAQSAWQGPFYRPPGVLIELLGDHIRLTRSDGKFFRNSDGTTNAQGNGSVIDIPLSDAARAALPTIAGTAPIPPFPHDGDDPATNGVATTGENKNALKIDPNSYAVNVVLFAEGNIRIKGVFGTVSDTTRSTAQLSRVHLTLITGGTAYVEGNLLKGDGTIAGAGGQVVMQRNSTCQVIAKDYVCVNTSMFTQPANQTNVWSRVTPDLDVFATEVGLARTSVDMKTSNGVDPATYNFGQMLFVSHSVAAPGATAINLLINPVLDNGSGNTAYLFGGVGRTYPLGIRLVNGLLVPDPTAVAPQFEKTTFAPFDGTVNTNAAQSYTELQPGEPGIDQLLRFQLDQTFASTNGLTFSPLQSYLLGNVAIAPADVRIEAALYAQDKSFFIIPGYSFNPDANDTRAHFKAIGTRTSYNTQQDSAAQLEQKNRFPYANEPLDVRITICGAIAENYTANVGAQSAWLKSWGYIPDFYGSSTTAQIPNDHLLARSAGPNAHLPLGYVPGDPGTNDYRSQLETQINQPPLYQNDFALTRGLTFEYDPTLAMPYFHGSDAGLIGNRATRKARAIRLNIQPANLGVAGQVFRRVLPPTPKLPVGPDLVYQGQSNALIGDDANDTDLF